MATKRPLRALLRGPGLMPSPAKPEGNRTASMTEDELRKRLAALRVEHRDLDIAIEALVQSGGPDQVQVARLKKRKLRLRDQISHIEDHLTPDIIA